MLLFNEIYRLIFLRKHLLNLYNYHFFNNVNRFIEFKVEHLYQKSGDSKLIKNHIMIICKKADCFLNLNKNKKYVFFIKINFMR